MPEKPLRLTPDLVLAAYREGYFPMAESRTGPVSWYSPDPRAIIPLDAFHVSRSLRRVVRSSRFSVTVDTDFERTIRGCADREETWISGEIIETYAALHLRGLAHSVESWREGRLAGGLYGVALGGAFFGESMFSLERDASKVALVHLVRILREGGFLLLDTQFVNPHLERFGVREIPRPLYLRLLSRAVGARATFGGITWETA